MKKNVFVIDFVDGKIYGSKTALKKAGQPGTAEYKELTSKMAAHPTFKVCEKEANTKKKTYEGLDFIVMRNYIQAQENADELMAEFEAVRKIANGKYGFVKKWFLDTFKDFNIKDAKKAISDKNVVRAKATVKRVVKNQAADNAA